MSISKRGKTFTLKGPAAGAYLAAQAGALAVTVDDQALRVASVIALYMQTDSAVAVALIKQVAKDGLEAASKTCTAAR